jgi:hypothetical protein
MKSGGTPVSGHISFMTRSCKWRILEAFKIFFPMPFLSTVSITEENYMPRKLIYSSFQLFMISDISIKKDHH